TENSSYIIVLDALGHGLHLYYGGQLEHRESFENLYSPMELGQGCSISASKDTPGLSLNNIPREYGEISRGDYRLGSVELQDIQGDQAWDFTFSEARILQDKKEIPGLPSALPAQDTQTLELDFKDLANRAVLRLVYSVFPEWDVITRRAEIHNLQDRLTVKNLMSFSLDFSQGSWDITSLPGRWIAERQIHRRPLQQGITEMNSRRGISSHDCSPFFMLQHPGSSEHQGESYAFSLVYSGSFSARIEQSNREEIRLQLGINPQGFSWELKKNQIFHSPEGVLSYSSEGSNGIRRNMHGFVQNHIIRGPWQWKDRPVLINSWEANYFDVNEKKILKQAKQAADLGMELYVLDDGWFGHRDDDTSSLGDWFPHAKKFPRGLKPLAEKINALGMDFGIWVEPEMICLDSKLYREHPDWLVQSPSGLEPCPGRNQYILDLTREEVCDYIKDSLGTLLKSAPIGYMKWDMNRSLSDLYSPGLPPENQGEFQHRYQLGLYSILEYVSAHCPELLLEGCASGGGRFDLAMLCYSPQIWTSDNSDGFERQAIQRGTSLFAPPSTMGAHVSSVPNHQLLRQTTLETRFNTAAFGVLGYELDPGKLRPWEKKVIQGPIKL
nr:alpha-galactosidase [Spirochaetaceae bacterium]